MTAELDLYRAARLIIDQKGDGAANDALKRGEQLFDSGDADGAATWLLILNAIVELQRVRRDGEAVN